MTFRALACAAIVFWSVATVAMAGDPFDDARYYIGIKQNAQAIALLDSGTFDVNMQTPEGYSLLHYAADAGNLEMVKELLRRGANPLLKSASGSTPYQMAIGTMVQAELRKAMSSSVPSAAGAFDAAPAQAPGLHAAAKGNGLCAMVRAEPVNDGRSPAQRPFLKAKDAIWYNHPDELEGLLDDCVKVTDTDAYGQTLLHVAADRGRLAMARLLLARGADRTATDRDGNTPAHLAQTPEMQQLLGSAPALNGARTRHNTGSSGNSTACEQKYRADVALASDSTGKARSYRRWQQCLKTGLYW